MQEWRNIKLAKVHGINNVDHTWRNGKIHRVVGIYSNQVCVVALGRQGDKGVKLHPRRLSVKLTSQKKQKKNQVVWQLRISYFVVRNVIFVKKQK